MLVFIDIFEFRRVLITLLNILFCQNDLHHANVIGIGLQLLIAVLITQMGVQLLIPKQK